MGFNPFINDSGGGGGVGPRGPKGPAGESAYEIWLDEGNTGTEQDFLDSLKGEPGPAGPQGPQGVKGETGSQGPQGEAGAAGAKGETGNGIDDIEKTSTSGKVDTYTINFTDGTTSTFSVTNGTDGQNGQPGKDGADGADGQPGQDGVDGVSVTDVEVNSSNHLIVTLSDSSEIDAGEVQGRLTVLTYGTSTWNDFLTAYRNSTLVFCKAYSTGSQTRLAFMAYVNNDSNPTQVEFQYYRSISNKNLSNQCDQVIIYQLDNTGTWTTTTRNTDVKFAAGDGLAANYANSTLTFAHTNSVTAKTTQEFAQIAYDAQGHITGSTAATTAQADAINSGITSANVAQITTNKNNILSVKDHYKYYNRTLFEQESIPTGTIANGSTWIDGKAVRTYNQTTNIVGGVIEQGSWRTDIFIKIDSTTRCRLSNSITVQPNTTYTIRLVSPTINNARLLLQYRDSNDYTSSESGWQTTLPYTFTTPSNCYKATIILSTVGDLICTPTNFGDLQINEGNTALSYEAPSWSTADSEIITPALKECVDNGVKNEFYFGRVENGNNGSYSLNGGTITVTGTAPWAQARCYFNVKEPGDYTVSVKVVSLTTQKGAINIQDVTTSSVISGGVSISATGTYTLNVTLDSTHDYWLTLMVNNTASTISSSNIVFTDIMLCKSELYKVSPAFEPYALPNATLTPALVECVDNGAKNLINTTIANLKANNEAGTWDGNKYTTNGVEWTINDDGSVKVKSLNSTHSESLLWYYNNKSSMPQNIKVGDRIHASSKTNTNNTGISVWNSINGTSWNDQIMTDNNNEINVPQNTTGLGIRLLVMANQSVDTTLYPMICSADDWAVSSAYQPYALSNAELTDSKQEKNAINIGTTNFNDIKVGGTYFSGNVGTSQNAPTSGYFFLNVINGASDSILQEAYRLNNPDKVYRRQFVTNTWSAWYVFTGTVVS